MKNQSLKGLKCYLIAFLFVNNIFLINAQDKPNQCTPQLKIVNETSNYYESINTIFSELSISRIPTGILKDKSILNYELIYANGNQGCLTLDQKKWEQVLYTLDRASISPSHLFNDYNMMIKNKTQNSAGEIFIGLINYKYNQIKRDAFNLKLLTWENGKIHDVYPLGASPYEEKETNAASILNGDITINKNYEFVLCKDLYFTNKLSSPFSIKINMDDGMGLRQINFDNKFLVHYNTPGIKNIEIVITDLISKKNSYYRCSQDVDTIPPSGSPPIHWKIPPTGVAACSKTYLSNPMLTKPVVIVDYLNENTNNFARSLPNINWTDFYNFYNQNGLLDSLKSHKYDIILLGYCSNTNTIQNNADVITGYYEGGIHRYGLIDSIAFKLSSSGTNTIFIGAGIGGIITRYALKNMEDSSKNHHTDLFISLDVPNQGANIPLGYQYLWEKLSGESNTINQLNLRINSIVFKQLLYYHLFGIHINPLTNLGDIVSCGDKINLFSTLGYPDSLRKVAISNGNGNGYKLFNKETQLLNWTDITSTGIDKNSKVWPLNNSDTYKTILERTMNTPSSSETNTIKTKCTLLYDNAPGAYSNKFAPSFYGTDYITPNYCFVPTISALDINTNNLFQNITGGGFSTPFDAIYYQPSNNNKEYLTISPDCRDWILHEIMNLSSKNKTGLIQKHQLYKIPELKIFPNPNNGIFNLEISNVKEIFNIDIINNIGQTILKKEYNSSSINIDISEFPRGIYFVKIENNSNVLVNKILYQ